MNVRSIEDLLPPVYVVSDAAAYAGRSAMEPDLAPNRCGTWLRPDSAGPRDCSGNRLDFALIFLAEFVGSVGGTIQAGSTTVGFDP